YLSVATFDGSSTSTITMHRVSDNMYKKKDQIAISGTAIDVLLSPDAVAEFLLPSLTTALCADAVRKGQSPLAGKVGEAIAAPQFTLVDDATLPGQVASSAFDREGVPTRRFVLVKDGILQGYLYNHYEARAAGGGVQSTGHASGGAGSPPGIGPTFLDLAAGEQANEDLVCAGERAVVVNRFSGSTNPVNGDFSGVVKNGFLLSGGERRAIKEVLIAGNLFDALRGVSAGSRERRLIGGTRLVPTLRIEGVSVTAG
ncbi:MAG: metallopeptidase TldD-related protein, partial [Candidatus Binatia bacterium]